MDDFNISTKHNWMNATLTLLAFLSLTFSSFAQIDKQKYAKELAGNGKVKEALAVIDEVIRNNPPQASFYHDKANYQLELKDYEGLMMTLAAGIKVMPDSVSLYDMRGTWLEAVGLYDEAIQDFTTGYNKAIENKLKSHLLANRGGTKARTRNFQGAYDDLVTAIKLDPANVDALNNLAAVCDEVGKSDETLKYLKQIISIDPEYTAAYVNMGFRLQLLGQHKEAIGYFTKAIEMNPNEALAYSNRSFSRLRLKDHEGAIRDINESIRLLSTNSYAYKIKAMIEIEMGKIDDACLNLKKALDLGYSAQYGGEVNDLINKNCKK